MTNHAYHQPVLLQAAIEALQVQPQGWYLDATFGRGGHTQALLAAQAKVIAFDFDEQAISWGQAHFADALAQQQLILLRENFTQIAVQIQQLQQSAQAKLPSHPHQEQTVGPILGVLFDFGTSVDQFKTTVPGLSFDHLDEILDMRLDTRLQVKACDLLAVLAEKQLTYIFAEFGGEHQARAIAKSIVRARKIQPITTVDQLLKIVLPLKRHELRQPHKLHPATKVFQALRIAVNDELSSIELALPQALSILAPGGRLVTIAFHEGEDRLVKNQFKVWETAQLGKMINKKPLIPDQTELNVNPRARSAKLRIFEKK